MAKTKKTKPQITQGGINITGNVTIKNSRIAGRDNVEKNIVNVNLSFAPVYHALKESATITSETKKVVEEGVRQIEQEVKKGDKAKGSFIQQRLAFFRLCKSCKCSMATGLERRYQGLGFI